MCGFYGTNLDVDYFEDQLICRRGPDESSRKKYYDFLVTHHLLKLDSESTIQPYIKDDILVAFNGEFYMDLKNSEVEYMVDEYKKQGINFVKNLDGEFSIVLIDAQKDLAFIVTDDFRTKPIFYSLDRGFSFSSYECFLNDIGVKNVVKPDVGSIITINTKSNEVVCSEKLYEFDLNQHKDTFDDWVVAFKNSVAKRSDPKKGKGIFVGLSSGYDSGAIAFELKRQDREFLTFSVLGTETPSILKERVDLLASEKVRCAGWGKEPGIEAMCIEHIRSSTENKRYDIYSSQGDYVEDTKMDSDNGCKWLVSVCHAARENEHRICLSGGGADEIFSDYGFGGKRIYPHSNFGGKFPDDLSEIFPWASFYESTMSSYMMKEEYVGGSFGIETRYPFLDRMVVQEFLCLKPELKNSKYKSVLDHYLTENQVPFERDVKRGF